MRHFDLLNSGVARIALSLMIAVSAMPAQAQTAPADEAEDGGEIVVTATRKAAPATPIRARSTMIRTSRSIRPTRSSMAAPASNSAIWICHST
jgi:outer membrane cobalamin receptor